MINDARACGRRHNLTRLLPGKHEGEDAIDLLFPSEFVNFCLEKIR